MLYAYCEGPDCSEVRECLGYHKTEAIKVLRDEGWMVCRDGSVYCPECKKKVLR